MKRTMLVALMLLLGWSIVTAFADEAGEKAATAAAPVWLSQIDAGSYSNSWRDASVYFKGAVSEKGWQDALTGARKPLGKLISRKLSKAQSATLLPGAPDGKYVVMQFDSSFANKQTAVETVTFMQEKDGKWRAAGYYIK
jgi:uncharacterized protein DUF4019